MPIVRLQHIGIAVRDFLASWDRFEIVLGMKPRDFRNDQAKGMQHDARVLLGNDCWIHIVHNWNPESRVYRHLERHGEGLEHIALETSDIEADVKRLRDRGVSLFQDKIFNANDGYEAFVYPEDAIGFTVELIQPHPTSWTYPEDARTAPLSTSLGIRRVGHLTAVVRDVDAARHRFEDLFDLRAREGSIPLGDNCALVLLQDPAVEPLDRGLERIAFETATLEEDLKRLSALDRRIVKTRVLPPEKGVGFTVELCAAT